MSTLLHVQRLGQLAGVQRPGAAKGDEGELARVEAALDRDGTDGPLHRGIGHAHDAQRRRRRHRPASPGPGRPGRAGLRATSRLMRPPRKSALDSRPSARLASVTVGIDAAAAIAHRPRLSARALRPHAQRSAAVDARQRAAARAHGVYVDHRQAQRQPGHLLLRRLLDAPRQQRDVGGRAAHVKGDNLREAGQARHVIGAAHTCRRAGEHQARRRLLRRLDAHHAARRLHQEEVIDALARAARR